MDRFKLIAIVLIMMLCLSACTGDGMNGSVKLTSGSLDTENAKAVYELDKQRDALTDASLELFKGACSTESSSMVSPFSILQALCLCANGANGETLAQIEDACGCSIDELNEWALAYNTYIGNAEEPAVINSNAIWFREEGFEVSEGYPEKLSSYYGASAYKAPFDETTVDDINGWVKKNTKERIENLISELQDTDMAVIVNAVTFDGTWLNAYEDEDLSDDIFTTEDGKEQTVTMMSSNENEFLEGDNFTGVRKFYNEGYSFVALLPNEDTTVAELVDSLDGATFRGAVTSSDFCDVVTKIPEFKSDYTADDVIGAMNNMGITDLFSPEKADLSGVGTSDLGNLFVGKIVHKTFIDVNKDGTEAAAATGMMMMAMSAAPPEETKYVILDRPFVYAIIDDATNMPIFIGTCMSIE